MKFKKVKYERVPETQAEKLQKGVQILQRNQQVDFNDEQQMLQSMFGQGGGTFWGLDDSTSGVAINNDLHPSLNGNSDGNAETSDLFGFGNKRIRSGLF